MRFRRLLTSLQVWSGTVFATLMLVLLIGSVIPAQGQIVAMTLPTVTPAEVATTTLISVTPGAATQLRPLTVAMEAQLPIPPLCQAGPRVRPCNCPPPELRYFFPVQPPEVAIYAVAHHDYPATDIFAPRRSVFVAVTNGVIDELSYDDLWAPAADDGGQRSGRYVTIIGDDGVRYHSSHLDDIVPGLAPGDRVVAGQLLGYVGSSGNARGIAPHLHFGISYPTYPGDWETRRGVISPYPYLQAWTRHEVVTPDLSSVRVDE